VVRRLVQDQMFGHLERHCGVDHDAASPLRVLVPSDPEFVGAS
jgi:hypothetical protein